MSEHQRRTQNLYVLTPEDGDRIDHLLGVLAMAITELLLSKRIKIPETPNMMPAEEQLMDERCDVGSEFMKSDAYNDDF